MVSQDSPSNSNSSNLHQFIISNSIPNNQNQFVTHNFNPSYVTDSVSNTHYSHSLLDLLGTSNEAAAQRLSLSLGSNQTPLNFNSAYLSTYSFTGNGFNQSCSYGNESLSGIIGSSKYLKPAQSLLEEIVGVGCKEIDLINEKYVEKLSHGRKGFFGLSNEIKAELSNTEVLNENHEGCINLLKLLAMLEEVERRYEEYYQHMEELITSFEMTAGLGAGKSYTSLALQAMSKHFSNLRNAILSQLRIAKQKMTKDMPKISSRLSQLSMIDQNRIPLQQLGIMQNSRPAWRPIRGLPETSVSILRAWLFQHFLNPYPNDSEKLMLASQTCLSKTQVSNWFINARVRLWKPMIEEMYKDELAAESSVESDPVLTSEGVGDSADDLN